jgi:hypothetical protein
VYAQKTIQTLFKPEQLKNAAVKIFNYSSSCIAYNKGQGNFNINKLPVAAQLSSVNAVLCRDMDADGKTDLVLAGNLADCLPQFGRLDAARGTVLLNKGNKQWAAMPATQTGLVVTGVTRDIAWITQKNNAALLFLRNNDYPVMYTMQLKKVQ